jgi:hypothetical protein
VNGATRTAYAFYATNDTYAIAVLVFARLLRQMSPGDDAAIIVLYFGVSRHLIEMMRALGAVTQPVARLPYARGLYRDSFAKLYVFGLEAFDRIVFMDADAIPLRRLDALFAASFDGPIAAPRAYWLPQPFWTAHLLVVKPSLSLWERLSARFASAAERRWYDMDLINAEFGSEIFTLPDTVTCLDSEWEDRRRPGHFADPETAFAEVSLVHFTALGKPWSYSPARGRARRPHAHPAFHALRERWWAARDDLFAGTPPLTRVRYGASKSWARCITANRIANRVGAWVGR